MVPNNIGFRVWGLGFRVQGPIIFRELLLPILLGGAKELGIVHISIIRGAKEPRNLQNQ